MQGTALPRASELAGGLGISLEPPFLCEERAVKDLDNRERCNVKGVSFFLMELRSGQIAFGIVGDNIRVTSDDLPVKRPVRESIAQEAKQAVVEKVACRRKQGK